MIEFHIAGYPLNALVIIFRQREDFLLDLLGDSVGLRDRCFKPTTLSSLHFLPYFYL